MTAPERNAKQIVLAHIADMDFFEFQNTANSNRDLCNLTEREMHQAYLAWLEIKDEWENA